jgi:nitrate reductase alpha subunit
MSVRANDNYDELRSMLVGEVRASQQTDVRGLLEDSADAAAERILALMDSGDEKVSLAAAKDVLDRAGHRPADVVEHRHSFDNEMRIRIIEDQAIDIPVLELEAEDV